MKTITKISVALLVGISVTMFSCSKEETPAAPTTTTTTTTSTTGTPTTNFVTIGTTTVSLSSVACTNVFDVDVNDSVSVVTGSDVSGNTVLVAMFYGANATQANYTSVDDPMLLLSGKCMVTITRTGSVDELLEMDKDQQVTLRVTGDKRTVEINGKSFDIVQGGQTGKRTVTANYGCN